MKPYRVHCWIDVKANDVEEARLTASFALALILGATNVLNAQYVGTPVDLNKMRQASTKKRMKI